MKCVRDRIDAAAPQIQQALCSYEAAHPGSLNREIIHRHAVGLARFINACGLSGLLFDNEDNRIETDIKLVNAAGSNKNGEIPSRVLRDLGFDRASYGTVTHLPWKGNTDQAGPLAQRIWMYPDSASMVNFLGLPGIGSLAVAENLRRDKSCLPRTINLMATPSCACVEERITDIIQTMKSIRPHLNGEDKWELNISCPNTQGHDGNHQREVFQRELDDLLCEIYQVADLPMDIKLSPDTAADDFSRIIEVVSMYRHLKNEDRKKTMAKESGRFVTGFTTFNTTAKRGEYGIPADLRTPGGASGDAVYRLALIKQRAFATAMTALGTEHQFTINIVGGIDTVARLRDRVEAAAPARVAECHLYTPLIYKGPGLLRSLRRYQAK